MNFLVTGGAGYIGSHMVKLLQDFGFDPVILDNLSTGNEWSFKECELINVDIRDAERLSILLNKRKFDAVFHFAAKSIVTESLNEPDLYFKNNFIGTKNLISEMLKNDIDKLIFSSTAAIYGNPIRKVINETHPKNPLSPYGYSKLKCENYLYEISEHYKFKYISLRYFNAAGAHANGQLGEFHSPETHLIPSIFNAITKKKSRFVIYGNNHDTRDGTCVRDFVHVSDLVKAHYTALKSLEKSSLSNVYNLSSGKGLSVLEIIQSCEKYLNLKVDYEFGIKREGDPSDLVADCTKARKELSWKPSSSDIETILKTAWKWHNYVNKNLNMFS